ncbi:MAG: helix-turn-helix domain-containing protein, partial [Dehalobacterium sp.]
NKAVLRTDKGEKDVFPCRILTIVVGGNIYGYIIVPEIMSVLNKIDYIAIEHAGVIAAYEIVKQRAVEEDRKRLKRDFFNSLLAGKLKSLEAVSNLSSVHRLDCSKCYVCIVVEFENYEKFTSEDFLKEQEKLNNLQEKAIKATNETALKLNQHIITTEQGSKVVLFLQYNRDTNSESARKLSKIFARELFNAYKRINQKQYCYIGIGKLYNNILKLYLSYGEALEAIKLSKTLNERISHIDDFSIYRLFDLTEKEKVDAFMKNIYKLVENDKKNDSDLVKTLDTFFQCMANQTETAKRLYIHRNTLTYRINKIKSILGIDLDNPDECLELQIAIKILRFLSN